MVAHILSQDDKFSLKILIGSAHVRKRLNKCFSHTMLFSCFCQKLLIFFVFSDRLLNRGIKNLLFDGCMNFQFFYRFMRNFLFFFVALSLLKLIKKLLYFFMIFFK